MAELQPGAEAVLENKLPNDEASRGDVSGEALVATEKLLPVERWYAVSVRPRHEKLVSRHLEHQGLSCFLPVYRSVRRWKDRRKELDMALFPGYVFVNQDQASAGTSRQESKLDNLGSIAREVPDGRVDLTQGNLHTPSVARICTCWSRVSR